MMILSMWRVYGSFGCGGCISRSLINLSSAWMTAWPSGSAAQILEYPSLLRASGVRKALIAGSMRSSSYMASGPYLLRTYCLSFLTVISGSLDIASPASIMVFWNSMAHYSVIVISRRDTCMSFSIFFSASLAAFTSSFQCGGMSSNLVAPSSFSICLPIFSRCFPTMASFYLLYTKFCSSFFPMAFPILLPNLLLREAHFSYSILFPYLFMYTSTAPTQASRAPITLLSMWIPLWSLVGIGGFFSTMCHNLNSALMQACPSGVAQAAFSWESAIRGSGETDHLMIGSMRSSSCICSIGLFGTISGFLSMSYPKSFISLPILCPHFSSM